MKNKYFIKVSLLTIVLMVTGTLINISNPDNVPIGIALLGVCAILCLHLAIFVLKQIQLQEMKKEERLKQLEDEVTLLKKYIK